MYDSVSIAFVRGALVYTRGATFAKEKLNRKSEANCCAVGKTQERSSSGFGRAQSLCFRSAPDAFIRRTCGCGTSQSRLVHAKLIEASAKFARWAFSYFRGGALCRPIVRHAIVERVCQLVYGSMGSSDPFIASLG